MLLSSMYTHCTSPGNLEIIHTKIPICVDSKIFITPDEEIVYSSNESGTFQLNVFHSGNSRIIYPTIKNIFKPFSVEGIIHGLYDKNGEEKFQLTAGTLGPYSPSQADIDFIESSKSGNYIVLKEKDSEKIQLIDLKESEIKDIASLKGGYRSIHFSNSEDYVVLSHDEALTLVNLVDKEVIDLPIALKGIKYTPFLYGEAVYFSNNDTSDYHNIYKIAYGKDTITSSLILASDRDLRLPKYDGNRLYYLEIDKSQYLLKAFNPGDKEIQEYTSKGVVYDYSFLEKDRIIYTYSDLHRPKSIRVIQKFGSSSMDIVSDRVDHTIKAEYREVNKIPTYFLRDGKCQDDALVGMVFYFHPGLHADFSPRWDDVLMSLCNNGFLVVAPNLPMSSGYGKAYRNRKFEEAVFAVDELIPLLSEKYNLPIYFLSSSSGNMLMEASIMRNSDRIAAGASFFGLQNSYFKKAEIPILYLLGENDPLVRYKPRLSFLKDVKLSNKNIRIKSYSDEGHWFRNPENIEDARKRLIAFFLTYN